MKLQVAQPTLLLTAILLLMLALPRSAFAHAVNAPTELVSTLLDAAASGPFTVSASQYATEAFTEVEVQLGVFGGILPEDTRVTLEAVSAETQTPYSATLIRHHNAYSTTLPLNGEDWHVSISVESVAGSGSAEFTVTPYRAPVETPPLIRNLVFSAPFLLAVLVLILFRRFNIKLISSAPPPSKRNQAVMQS